MPDTAKLTPFSPPAECIDSALPAWARSLADLQTAIPELAKDAKRLAELDCAAGEIPTLHRSVHGDARELTGVESNSVHLVLTSPPYWTLKKYRDSDGQLGHFEDYNHFLSELDKVWQRCFEALVPGGRLICVVGDVCLSRRKNNGRHTVVPLHASIQEHCREIGFDNLAPIIWNKIANVVHEVENGGAGFLGKPYEPNAVIKNDIEFILMQRKPGGYRSPSNAARLLSIISDENHKTWFTQIWTGVTGASTRRHPAPYPELLAERLIRMFSFVGDTVLDPFLGTGTTTIAAIACGRNSVGYEIDDHYVSLARRRIFRKDGAIAFKCSVGDIRLMLSERRLQSGIEDAVRYFWKTRQGQAKKQRDSGRADQGSRGAVTGGKQMDGFVLLVREIITKSGLSSDCIHTETSLELPGYFRPEKKWDLVVVDGGVLVATIEFKSQIGPSFGNNFNNRSEEAIGTAQDIWTAYREGAFRTTERPWLGYVMMLEDCTRSTAPVSVRQPHFPVFPEFIDASYAERYRLLMTKLVRERLYDATCFLMSSRIKGQKGQFNHPDSELTIMKLAASLSGKIISHRNAKRGRTHA